MRLTGSRAYYRSTPPKMPSGLVDLIEGLTREVLKNNPTDIYAFCANHMHQLLEIRDGPIQKKALTLDEKIARAQEKVRQRAEQRWQQYTMDLLKHQNNNESEINSSSIVDDTSPIIPQESTVNVPVNNEHELVGSKFSEVGLSPSENPQYQNSDELVGKDNTDLKNVTENESEDIHLPQSTNDTTFTESCPSNTPPKSVDVENDMHDSNVETSTILSDVHDKCDGQKNHSENDLKENHELETDSLQGSDSVNRKHQHSSPIHSLIMNQGSVLFDSGDKIIDDSIIVTPEETFDNTKVEPNSITQTIDVVKNTAEPQSDEVLSSLNAEETQQSNNSGITNFIDSDSNQSNEFDNAELTNNVNANEDPQETNTFDISFKESPTVELQDPIINSDMLETLPETNTDRDIVTLITQDSINNESTQPNSLKDDGVNALNSKINADLPQTNSDLIENKNEENIENDNQSFDRSKLDNSTQILSQESNMDLETAAVTIQKVFRSFLFKSRASTFDDTVNDAMFLNEGDKNKEECDFPIAGPINERRAHGITRMDTVLQTVNEEKSLSLSTDDSSTLSSAATVIQAHVRGFLVRNKLNSNKTISTNSLAASNSNEPSLTSLEMDNEQNKNKTVLNIHIVPEGGNYLSRDESLITSMDLSLDSSPPSSINLHPLGYDKSERRKQLKREDAIQSISPPSNNSGKLSEDVDSIKELPLNDHEITEEHKSEDNNFEKDDIQEGTTSQNVEIPQDANVVSDAEVLVEQKQSLAQMNSDEMDVVTPFIPNEDNISSDKKLMHSGEFHDAVLPTKVSRSDTTVASGE